MLGNAVVLNDLNEIISPLVIFLEVDKVVMLRVFVFFLLGKFFKIVISFIVFRSFYIAWYFMYRGCSLFFYVWPIILQGDGTGLLLSIWIQCTTRKFILYTL